MSLKVYRGRTLARSQALQLLFQAEATDSPLERVLEGDFLISKGPLDPYALELCRGAYEHIDRIDCALRAVAKNWDLMRMPGADRNLLRIAVYEMRFLTDEEVSDAIVINEAVELAKAYGTDQSASFVNGVLGKIARSEELPGEDLYHSCWPRIVLARRRRLQRRPPRLRLLRLRLACWPRMRTPPRLLSTPSRSSHARGFRPQLRRDLGASGPDHRYRSLQGYVLGAFARFV